MREPKWVKRFTARGATGTYLRVVVPGEIRAGDRIEVIAGGAHGHGQRDAVHPDPERLLAREEIGPGHTVAGPAVAGQCNPQHAPPRRPPGQATRLPPRDPS